MEDISVAVVIEATKFIFNELSKWINRIRQRDTKEGSSVLQLTRVEFEYLLNNSNEFITAINRLEVKRHCYELKTIVGQLQIHKKILLILKNH